MPSPPSAASRTCVWQPETLEGPEMFSWPSSFTCENAKGTGRVHIFDTSMLEEYHIAC